MAGEVSPVAAGRAEDFEAMYRRELTSMIALGTTLTGSADAGVDLAHEAMLRAYRAWPSVGEMDRPGAWVRRVLINLAIDRHRRARREETVVHHLAPATAAAPDVDLFWATVRRLPDRQRAAVALRYIDDMTVEQIAEVLDVSAGTVKTSLFRAHKTLDATLRAQEMG
jgi:RNA polymerase sigma factor (sigma-70 family)